MKRSRLILPCVLLLCLAGAWVSGDLVRQHAGASDGLLVKVCRAATGGGCAGALESRWSTITIPLIVRRVEVPVAFLGLAYFVFMGTWFGLLGGPRPFGRPWHRLPLRLGYCSLPVSAVLVGLMAAGASPWCLLCLAAHVINVLLVAAARRLVAGSRSAATPVTSAPESLARITLTTREVLATVAVALAVVAGLWLHRRDNLVHRRERIRLAAFETMVESLQRDRAFLQREFVAQPRYEIPLRETETGTENRPRLVVFTDYQCPACICNHVTIENHIVGVFDRAIDVHVRHYPLAIHPDAAGAARFAEAVRLLGGEEAFKRVHDLLFARQGAVGDVAYREMAAELGLDPDDVAARMESDQVHRLVQDDMDLGDALGVTATPSMFLDGRPVPELLRTPAFWRTYAEHYGRPAGVEMAGVVHTEDRP